MAGYWIRDDESVIKIDTDYADAKMARFYYRRDKFRQETILSAGFITKKYLLKAYKRFAPIEH